MTEPRRQTCIETESHIRDYLLAVVNEREAKYDIRFSNLERAIADSSAAVKDALMLAGSATRDAMAAVDRRFDSVNEFRGQMADQQATLVRKTEVDIRFDALEKKLDSAISVLTLAKGQSSGVQSAWAVAVVLLTLVLSASAVAAALLAK